MDLIRAPFTAEQAATLNRWQGQSNLHPYTCPHHAHDRILVANAGGGWTCPTCDYTQDWALCAPDIPREAG